MKTSIWKFPLEITDSQTVILPAGAKVLSVAEQHGGIVLYAHVDTESEDVWTKRVWIYGTGHPINTDNKDRWSVRSRFLGTVNLRGGALMFHVFVED